jgi:hypothetical protein
MGKFPVKLKSADRSPKIIYILWLYLFKIRGKYMNKILKTNYLLITMISIIILGLASCDSNAEDIDVKLEKYFEDEAIIKYQIFDDDDYVTVLSKIPLVPGTASLFNFSLNSSL